MSALTPEKMEELSMVAFTIIANVGTAKSCYLESLQLVREKDLINAQAKIEEGDQFYQIGHHSHLKTITDEAQLAQPQISLLLAHAEDQLMSAETIKIMVQEFIKLYQVVLNP